MRTIRSNSLKYRIFTKVIVLTMGAMWLGSCKTTKTVESNNRKNLVEKNIIKSDSSVIKNKVSNEISYISVNKDLIDSVKKINSDVKDYKVKSLDSIPAILKKVFPDVFFFGIETYPIPPKGTVN